MKSRKRTSIPFLIIITTLLFLSQQSHTVYADTENYTYYLNESGLIITGYQGQEGSLTIPEEIDGHIVVGISNDAFNSSAILTEVVLPEGVVYIGDNAFRNCTNLTAVTFLGDAPVIGGQVFDNCSPRFTIYYYPVKSGFANPWNGYMTATVPSIPEVSPIPENIPVSGLTLDITSLALMAGESRKLQPTITPNNASDQQVYWSSSNPGVATVDESGTVKAVQTGNAVIYAVTQGEEFQTACSVTVINLLTVPTGEFGVPQNYDAVKLTWYGVAGATGYEVYRQEEATGEYIKIASSVVTEYSDKGLKTGTNYKYKIRAYQTVLGQTFYSDFTPIITVKTLGKNIGSTLFLYMSSLDNRNSILARAIALHYGDPSNTCAYTVSEAFRRLGLDLPDSTARTNQVESHLVARGWKREMNLNLLQPGDICFTTDRYGNLLGGHSTHVFIFMSWANKEKTLMNICDNQTGRYGTVLHTRTIFSTSLTDATAFFYHTELANINLILKLPSTVASPVAYDKVKLSWKTAAGAYGYKVYRSSSKYGSYANIATTRNTSFTNSNVVTGRTYFYKVRAFNYIGPAVLYGSYSDILATKPTLSVPATYVDSNYNGRIKLEWNGISGATGYQIYRSASKDGYYTHVTDTTSTAYIKSGLIKGKNYYYKIRAYRYVGNTKVYSNYSYINLKVL